MARRPQQLPLRLDGSTPRTERWRAGAQVSFLGERLTLLLASEGTAPQRRGAALLLPLPPGATARQIRDAAESWLREEALRLFRESALARRHDLRVVLAFGRRPPWVRLDGDVLRCHWRLIELPRPQIEALLTRVLTPAAAGTTGELFPRAP